MPEEETKTYESWDQEELVNLETAKLLQAKGFVAATVLDVFVPDKNNADNWEEAQLVWDLLPGYFHDNRVDRLLRPSLSQTETWLRDKHELFVQIKSPYFDVPWQASVFKVGEYSTQVNIDDCSTYREVREQALLAALKLLPDAGADQT